MEWYTLICALAIVCTTIVLVFLIKGIEKWILQSQNFKQNKKLEELKLENAKALIAERSAAKGAIPDKVDDILYRLEKLAKDLAEKKQTNDLAIANARLELYKEFFNKK